MHLGDSDSSAIRRSHRSQSQSPLAGCLVIVIVVREQRVKTNDARATYISTLANIRKDENEEDRIRSVTLSRCARNAAYRTTMTRLTSLAGDNSTINLKYARKGVRSLSSNDFIIAIIFTVAENVAVSRLIRDRSRRYRAENACSLDITIHNSISDALLAQPSCAPDDSSLRPRNYLLLCNSKVRSQSVSQSVSSDDRFVTTSPGGGNPVTRRHPRVTGEGGGRRRGRKGIIIFCSPHSADSVPSVVTRGERESRRCASCAGTTHRNRPGLRAVT